MKSSRRGLFKLLPAAALGAAGLVGKSEAESPKAPEMPDRWVHYVLGNRCINARVVETDPGRGWLVEFEHRPPTPGPKGTPPLYHYQRVWTDKHCEPTELKQVGDLGRYEQGPVPGSWHEAEGCPCGRDYSDFAYGRRRKSDAEALAHAPLDEDEARLVEIDQGLRRGFYQKPDGARPPIARLDMNPLTGKRFEDRVKIGAIDPRTGEPFRA